MRKHVAIAGDLHLPWLDKGCAQYFFNYLEKEKPDVVVQIGDIYDLYSFSRFPGTRGLIKPDEELVQARIAGEEFWSYVRRLVPKATCYQILGNHDIRPIKYSLETAPVLESFVTKGLLELYKFEGVNTLPYEDDLMIDGNVYIHGHTQHGKHMEEYMSNVILGHTHRGGVVTKRMFRRLREKIIFELNVGYMGNPASKCFSYKKKTFPWTTGFGVVTKGNVPIFYPYNPKKVKES